MKSNTENTLEPDDGLSPDNVAAAFRYLEEAMENEKGRLDEEGADAMRHGDYDTVNAVIEFTSRLQVLAKDAGALFEKWRAMGELREPLNQRVRDYVSKTPSIRREGKLSLKKNPEFCRHILTALVSLGGTGIGTAVIKAVRGKVTAHYTQLQGARAMIDRLNLVKGIQRKNDEWTITKAGKAWLEENAPKG